jgi:hypothetical protein
VLEEGGWQAVKDSNAAIRSRSKNSERLVTRSTYQGPRGAPHHRVFTHFFLAERRNFGT